VVLVEMQERQEIFLQVLEQQEELEEQEVSVAQCM
jgi:hypothetical protein